jgi:hypothetical protein
MALSTLDAQGQMANSNPNIISDTYTGSTGGGTTSLQPAPTAPSSSQALATQVAGVPGMEQATNVATGLANNLYSSQFVPGMESQRNAMIQELYDYDNMMGDIYAGQSYFPQVEGYVDNPADMFGAIAGVSGATGSDISRTASTIDATERAYNMAVANVMDRFMDFYRMQAEEKRWEREMQLEEKKAGLSGSDDEADRMAMAVLFGADPTMAASGNLMGALASAGQSQTGPNLQSLRSAILLNPKGAQKYTGLYESFNPGGGELPAGMQKQVITNQATLRQVNDLWDLYNQIPAMQRGPFGQGTAGSVLSKFTGTDLANQFDELRWAVATNIARSVYGETGMVSDKDIERIAQSLPSRFEPETKAGQKFNRLVTNLQSGMSDIATVTGTDPASFGGGGYNQPTFGTYDSPSSMDTYAGTGGMEIAVEDLQSGIRGWVDESEFDPNLYRRL